MNDSEQAIKNRIADLKREIRSLYKRLDEIKMGAWYATHKERTEKASIKKKAELRIGLLIIKAIQSGKSIPEAAVEIGVKKEKARELAKRAWEHYDINHYHAAIRERGVGIVNGIRNFKAELPS
jgi:hypothetical protein